MSDVRNVIILGAGPAGLTAALYNARADLEPLVFAGYELPGGQLTTTTDVENFPGFPEGISGPDLMEKMFAQAERFGAEVQRELVTRVDLSERPFGVWVDDMEFRANALIISTGAAARKLGIPSEQTYWGVHPGGVTSCATCDGAFYRGKEVAVIGGGDSALEEATFLTRFASKVYVVHRRDTLRASKAMQQRAHEEPKLEFVWSHVVDEVKGDGKRMNALALKHAQTGAPRELAVEGMFLAVGHIPNTALFAGQVELDAEGYVKVDAHQRTSVPGVYACGDVHDTRYRQAITAAGCGCAAALEVEHYLSAAAGQAAASQLYGLTD